ncbi:hypothetical protein AMS68_004987 [Peltaster fructicola]|uniref:Velvet domain-containing protein n=1 Tax=Peltaster fructicola TaxID=286661 RepID=A0A6H0XYH8_9PEZI|nr:hypothetical protein AMS68_004987 [Peltaster fructicola]
MAYPGDGHFRPHASNVSQYGGPDHLWQTPSLPTRQHPQQQSPALARGAVTLSVRQQPSQALATSDGKEKTRKPIDPPPIVRIHVDDRADPNRFFLFSPHLFVMASLIPEGADTATSRTQKGIIGETCSAIHRLKDLDNKEGGYFVFGDISVRKPGKYRLHFALFNNESASAYTMITDVTSNVFSVLSSKDFQGMDESTIISRSFNEQGVRLRMRKEPRSRQVAAYQPELETNSPNPHHHVHNDYQQLAHQQYATHGIYQDERGMKRQREDDNDNRITPAQLPRTAYYPHPYQTPTTHQYSQAGIPVQNYPVQHMLSQNTHQPPIILL